MKNTPMLNIDISAVGIEGASDLLIRELKEKNLYDPHFLYAGVKGKDVEELLLHGSLKGKIIGLDDIFDNLVLPGLRRLTRHVVLEDYIFAGKEGDLRAPMVGIRNPLHCVGWYSPPEKRAEYPALAVYDDLGLAPAVNCNLKSGYLNRVMKFLDTNRRLDALVAVAVFNSTKVL